MQSILNSISFRVKLFICSKIGFPVVHIRKSESNKRALLVYLSEPLRWKANDTRYNGHQSCDQSRKLAQLLSQRGYNVDVATFNDDKFIPEDIYDLVISHPGIVEEKSRLLSSPIKVFLRSSCHATFINQAARERYESLRMRRNAALEWTEVRESDEIYRGYTAIACFDGNGHASGTYKHIDVPVFSFRNQSNPIVHYIDKDFKKARSAFIYLAANKHIVKGLDWLIELFSERTDLKLIICGVLDKSIKDIYRKELKQKNIQMMGMVSMKSKRFRRACRHAAFMVSPSASDGCQGAVLDAMAAGLIPLVSTACGVEIYNGGILIDPCTIDALNKCIDHVSHMTEKELRSMSISAANIARTKYSSEQYIDDWNIILDKIGA